MGPVPSQGTVTVEEEGRGEGRAAWRLRVGRCGKGPQAKGREQLPEAERQETDGPLEPPKGATALPTPDFQPRETCPELLTDRTAR